MNKKFVLINILIIITLFFFSPLVSASYFNNTSGDLGTLMNGAAAPSDVDGATVNENEILSQAKYDASNISFRNLDTLNVRIDSLWQFVRWGLSIFSVFGTISSFFILTKSFLQLAWIPDHPIQRRKVYTDILTSGICTVLFAGLALIMTVFFKTFENFLNNSVMLTSNYKAAFALFLVEYKYLISGFCGVMSLTLIIFLIKDIIVLAGSGGNPQARMTATRSIMFTILAIVGCGSVGLLVGIFTGLLV